MINHFVVLLLICVNFSGLKKLGKVNFLGKVWSVMMALVGVALRLRPLWLGNHLWFISSVRSIEIRWTHSRAEGCFIVETKVEMKLTHFSCSVLSSCLLSSNLLHTCKCILNLFLPLSKEWKITSLCVYRGLKSSFCVSEEKTKNNGFGTILWTIPIILIPAHFNH